MNGEQSTVNGEQLLDLAAKQGARVAEVYQSRSRSVPVLFEANRLKQLLNAETEGTALRVWVDGRPGLAVAYGLVEPTVLVERAIAISQLNESGAIELASKHQDIYPNLGRSVPAEQLVAWGREAIACIRDAYPEAICSGEWECDRESVRLINSRGLDCGYTDTTLHCYLSCEWVRGEDFLSASNGQTQRNSLDLQLLARHLLQRLEWAESNVAPPIGRVPVLFTAKAADLLWGTVSEALNGKRVLEKASPWSEKLGTPVISNQLTISQEPEAGPYSCPFDDEGTPTQSLIFIKNGILERFYTDLTIGKTIGQGTTGNGFRPDLSSYPTPSLYNFLIQPGRRSLLELISQLDDGLVIDQILGSGAGISGDFSINIDLGYRVRNGQILGRVKDTMVAGNVYQALKQMVALGNDAEWNDAEWNGSCYTPSIIVEGLSVTGKQSD